MEKKLALELKVAEKGKEVPGVIIFATGPETTEIWSLIKQNLAPSVPGQWRVALALNFCKWSDKRIVLRERLNQYCLDWEMRQLS